MSCSFLRRLRLLVIELKHAVMNLVPDTHEAKSASLHLSDAPEARGLSGILWVSTKFCQLLSIAAHCGWPIHTVKVQSGVSVISFTHASLSTATIRGDDSWYETQSSIKCSCSQNKARLLLWPAIASKALPVGVLRPARKAGVCRSAHAHVRLCKGVALRGATCVPVVAVQPSPASSF